MSVSRSSSVDFFQSLITLSEENTPPPPSGMASSATPINLGTVTHIQAPDSGSASARAKQAASTVISPEKSAAPPQEPASAPAPPLSAAEKARRLEREREAVAHWKALREAVEGQDLESVDWLLSKLLQTPDLAPHFSYWRGLIGSLEDPKRPLAFGSKDPREKIFDALLTYAILSPNYAKNPSLLRNWVKKNLQAFCYVGPESLAAAAQSGDYPNLLSLLFKKCPPAMREKVLPEAFLISLQLNGARRVYANSFETPLNKEPFEETNRLLSLAQEQGIEIGKNFLLDALKEIEPRRYHKSSQRVFYFLLSLLKFPDLPSLFAEYFSPSYTEFYRETLSLFPRGAVLGARYGIGDLFGKLRFFSRIDTRTSEERLGGLPRIQRTWIENLLRSLMWLHTDDPGLLEKYQSTKVFLSFLEQAFEKTELRKTLLAIFTELKRYLPRERRTFWGEVDVVELVIYCEKWEEAERRKNPPPPPSPPPAPRTSPLPSKPSSSPSLPQRPSSPLPPPAPLASPSLPQPSPSHLPPQPPSLELVKKFWENFQCPALDQPLFSPISRPAPALNFPPAPPRCRPLPPAPPASLLALSQPLSPLDIAPELPSPQPKKNSARGKRKTPTPEEPEAPALPVQMDYLKPPVIQRRSLPGRSLSPARKKGKGASTQECAILSVSSTGAASTLSFSKEPARAPSAAAPPAPSPFTQVETVRNGNCLPHAIALEFLRRRSIPSSIKEPERTVLLEQLRTQNVAGLIQSIRNFGAAAIEGPEDDASLTQLISAILEDWEQALLDVSPFLTSFQLVPPPLKEKIIRLRSREDAYTALDKTSIDYLYTTYQPPNTPKPASPIPLKTKIEFFLNGWKEEAAAISQKFSSISLELRQKIFREEYDCNAYTALERAQIWQAYVDHAKTDKAFLNIPFIKGLNALGIPVEVFTFSQEIGYVMMHEAIPQPGYEKISVHRPTDEHHYYGLI